MLSNSGSNRKSVNFGCIGKGLGFSTRTNRPMVLLRLILTTCVLTAFIYGLGKSESRSCPCWRTTRRSGRYRGEPFVRSAGAILDRALQEIVIERFAV